jgi:N-acetylglucosaminyl-diphospho-decaprenol L-rhamnosyltransferase
MAREERLARRSWTVPRLAIVIVNYNTAQLLCDCLDSIFAAPTQAQLAVWVVDNHSTDGSAELVAARYPQVRLIASARNGGFAYANNLALRPILAEARDDYILLLNADTVVPAGALDGLIGYLEAHPDVGVVGPKLLLADGSLDLACRRSFPTPEVAFYRMTGLSYLFPNSPRFGRYNLTYLDPNLEAEVDAVVGACMLLRTGVVREAGLLDEQFFMYGEDLDWTYRIKQYGWRVVYYPGVSVWHYKRASSRQRPLPSIRAFYDAMRIFHRKHYARSTPAPLNALIEIGISLKEAMAVGRNFLRPSAPSRVG